jgi:hypothetical protein
MDDVDEPRPELEKRIGDRERREVDAHLRQAHDDGVLTLTEYDERVAQCWAARTRVAVSLRAGQGGACGRPRARRRRRPGR